MTGVAEFEAQQVRYLHRRIWADEQTPIGIYRKVARRPGSFLLESALEAHAVGRYSYVGWQPLMRLQVQGGRVLLERDGERRRLSGDGWSALRSLYRELRVEGARPSDLPPFFGGMVGYVGYDMARGLERLGKRPPDARRLADLHIVVPRFLVAYDHLTRQVDIVVAHPRSEPLELAERQLLEAERLVTRGGRAPRHAGPRAYALMQQSPSSEEYRRRVVAAKRAIADGEVFQLVLSQRHDYRVQASSLEIYRELRAVNPSPYMFHLRAPRCTLFGSSPETLVRVQDGRVTLKPIAGTRPRPADPLAEERVGRELLGDPKERAEHLMLLDLGRNDVGRVASLGSVQVVKSFALERYSHVLHIVSEVVGELAPDRDPVDALAAAFPAGTLTGAPKIRAMQLIDELEPVGRGPYGGAVGYLGADGNMDFAIAIRSIVMQGETAHLQAGAGIVADSDPAYEDRECNQKLAALGQALRLAHGGAR